MIWTEVSGLLAVVAVLLVALCLVAIVFQEKRSKPVTGQIDNPRLPDNADLSIAERRNAMHRFDDHKN